MEVLFQPTCLLIESTVTNKNVKMSDGWQNALELYDLGYIFAHQGRLGLSIAELHAKRVSYNYSESYEVRIDYLA